MNDAVQKLLDKYKVDNSRETTDAIANALEVAVEALERMTFSKPTPQTEYFFITAKETIAKIAQIAESKQ